MTTEQLLSVMHKQSELIDQLYDLCKETLELLEQYKSIDEEEKRLRELRDA